MKELKAFSRVRLAPGESRKIEFILHPSQLGFYDLRGITASKPGILIYGWRQFRSPPWTNVFLKLKPIAMTKQQLYTVKTSLIVALGGFLMGFDASVISGVVRFIDRV